MTDERKLGADSRAIELLRFPMIVLVVFIHSPHGLAEPAEGGLLASFYNTLRITMSTGVSHVAVPCFFAISGYLFFLGVGEWNRRVYTAKIKKRARTLLVPYLLWNLIFAAAELALLLCRVLMGKGQWGDIVPWYEGHRGLMGMFILGPLDFPLWYLRDLMLVCLFTPAIHFLCRRFGLWFVGVMAVVYALSICADVGGFEATAFLFFSAGAFLSIRGASLSALLRVEKPAYILALATLVVLVYYGGAGYYESDIVRPFYCMAAVVAAFCLALRFQSHGLRAVRLLTDSVFFVYALHGLFIISLLCVDIPYRFIDSDNLIVLTALYIVVPFVKIAFCILVYVAMRRWAPRPLALLTGGR